MNWDIAQAAAAVRDGVLIAFPTETVYGLGGNALSDHAVARIYETKGRPTFNPLIVHVASMEEAQKYGELNEAAIKLAKAFWPGPLTLVVRRKPDCALSLLVSAGLDTVALRVPAHPLAQSLLKESGLPIAAPSANRSGRISPTQASHVREELGDKVDLILDGGACEVGIESTVVDVSGEHPALLRPGSITLEQLQAVCGKIEMDHDGSIKAPGMMQSHYAPSKSLRLNALETKVGEALLAFGPVKKVAAVMENLSEKGDLCEAAANLFRMLRALDASGAEAIAVMPVPNEGLGLAINDRLQRAAAPRV